MDKYIENSLEFINSELETIDLLNIAAKLCNPILEYEKYEIDASKIKKVNVLFLSDD